MTTVARDSRLDTIRGIAIVAVVFGHAARGLFGAGLAPEGGVLWTITERLIYFAHLPLFVFTTGVLIPQSVARVGATPYVRRRVGVLLWTLLIWTVIQGSVEVALSRWRNGTTSWSDLVRLWEPIGHLWYLPFLAIITTLVVTLSPWRSQRRAFVSLCFLTCFSLLLWGHNGTTVATMGMGLTVFLGAATAVRVEGLTAAWNRLGRAGCVLIGLAAGLLFLALALSSNAIPPTAQLPFDGVRTLDILGLIASASAVVAVLGLAGALKSGDKAGAMSYLGRHSLHIYLAHILVTAAVRIGLTQLGFVGVIGHIVLGTALGTILPLLLIPTARKIPWLLSPPTALRRSPNSS